MGWSIILLFYSIEGMVQVQGAATDRISYSAISRSANIMRRIQKDKSRIDSIIKL